MMTARAYLHHSMLSLPLMVGLGGLWGGPALAEGALWASLAFLGNLALFERIARRFVLAAAHGDDPAAVGQLILKQLTAVPLGVVLVVTLGPEAVALGIGCLASGALLFAAVNLLQSLDAASALAGLPRESEC